MALVVEITKKTDRIIRISGTYGSKLILSNIKEESYSGPCYSQWLEGEFIALELSNIQNGLQNFTVPESKIKLEENEKEKCEESMRL